MATKTGLRGLRMSHKVVTYGDAKKNWGCWFRDKTDDGEKHPRLQKACSREKKVS